MILTVLIILGIVIGIVVLIICVSLLMAAILTTGNRRTLKEGFERQKSRYDTKYYEVLEKKSYIIEGYNGYEIHVQFLKNTEPTDKYMIITHGYMDNRFGTLKYAWLYLELGFNCIIYDIRGHGLNKRTYTTYGVYESLDLCALIDDTLKRYPDLQFYVESIGPTKVGGSGPYSNRNVILLNELLREEYEPKGIWLDTNSYIVENDLVNSSGKGLRDDYHFKWATSRKELLKIRELVEADLKAKKEAKEAEKKKAEEKAAAEKAAAEKTAAEKTEAEKTKAS